MSSLVGLALTPSGGVCEIAFKSDRSLSDAADVPCMSGFDAPASFVACRSTYWPFNSAEALHEAQLRDVQSSFSRFEDLPCLQSYTRNIAWHCIMVQNNCAVLVLLQCFGQLTSQRELCMCQTYSDYCSKHLVQVLEQQCSCNFH